MYEATIVACNANSFSYGCALHLISLDLAYVVPRLGATVCLCSTPLLSMLKATGLPKSVGIVWTNRSQRLLELYIMVCLRSIS